MLSPNEYYKFITTGVYPLAIANPPKVPAILKRPSELGIKQDNTDWDVCSIKSPEKQKLIVRISWFYKTHCMNPGIP